jgi:hypothetical protein
VEIGLGAGVAAGSDGAARAAAVLMAGACVAQVGALSAGREGSPCACFGARGRVGRASAGRAAALAAALAVLPVLPHGRHEVAAPLAICVALAIVGFARSRRAHEPAEVGARSPLIAEFGALQPGQLGLAVFSSESCAICRALEPTVALFGLHASIVLRTFDDAGVPGTPYAIALDPDGTVLAKGAFTTGEQLEAVLAEADDAVLSPR